MKKLLLFFCCFLTCYINCYSQQRNEKKNKFFITPGYGIAGSFFVRSYEESAPLPDYKAFYKKHFIGASQNISIGINLKNNYQLQLGFNFQHFTRRINTSDTLNNSVIIYLYHTIHHRNYIWYAGVNKNFENKKHAFSAGLGIYYFRPKQEEVEIYTRYFSNVERDYKKYKLEEGGVYAEFAYEYKFQPKVNLGIKTQFYYTATAGYAESITLMPYIKISF